MKEKLSRISLAILVSLGVGLTACDREDRADVKEVGNEVEEGAEKVGEEVEEGVDHLDHDGKDD